MGRIRFYDPNESLQEATRIRRTFTKKEPRQLREQTWTWPDRLRHVGESMAVAYASDKWKRDGDFELYKHLAESRNDAWIAPSFELVSLSDPGKPWPVYGPEKDLTRVQMPEHFALLGHFEALNLRLHDASFEPNGRGVAREDRGVVQVTIRHAMLGGGVMVTAEGDRRPFLVVYSEATPSSDGELHLLVVGDKLDIEADGIVG